MPSDGGYCYIFDLNSVGGHVPADEEVFNKQLPEQQLHGGTSAICDYPIAALKMNLGDWVEKDLIDD